MEGGEKTCEQEGRNRNAVSLVGRRTLSRALADEAKLDLGLNHSEFKQFVTTACVGGGSHPDQVQGSKTEAQLGQMEDEKKGEAEMCTGMDAVFLLVRGSL